MSYGTTCGTKEMEVKRSSTRNPKTAGRLIAASLIESTDEIPLFTLKYQITDRTT